MFKLKNCHLDPKTKSELAKATDKVDQEDGHQNQKKKAKNLWDQFEKDPLINYLSACGNGPDLSLCAYCTRWLT